MRKSCVCGCAAPSWNEGWKRVVNRSFIDKGARVWIRSNGSYYVERKNRGRTDRQTGRKRHFEKGGSRLDSGYGRLLEKSWVQIPAVNTGWTWHLFTLICCKHFIVCLKDQKLSKKRPGLAHLKKDIAKKGWLRLCQYLQRRSRFDLIQPFITLLS